MKSIILILGLLLTSMLYGVDGEIDLKDPKLISKGSENNPCDYGECDPGLYCNEDNICKNSKLKDIGKEDYSCKDDKTCNEGLICNIDKICKLDAGQEGKSCRVDTGCDEGLACSKEEKICKKKDGMDFSDIIVESDQVDEDSEALEEKEILKKMNADKKKGVKASTLKIKKVKPKNFLEFFPLYLDISYLNMSLLDIPYNHNLSTELGLSFFSVVFSDFSVKLGRVAIAPIYDWSLISWEMAPISFTYQLKHRVHTFLFELEIYKTYRLFNKMHVKKYLDITAWTKFLSLKSSWYIIKRADKNLKLYFETALVSGNDKDSNSSLSFSLGITGDFSPIRLEF